MQRREKQVELKDYTDGPEALHLAAALAILPYGWVCAALLASMLDHRGRYRPHIKLHRRTWLYSVIVPAHATRSSKANARKQACRGEEREHPL